MSEIRQPRDGEDDYDPAMEAFKKKVRDWIAGGREGPAPEYDSSEMYMGEGEITTARQIKNRANLMKLRGQIAKGRQAASSTEKD